ncbi:uncharacterized protein MONBRDRAFT_4973 [Monosiga brevicollis MX1]|uniref:Putative hydroxypyruvate isomerase n=1 Tax=Monosiga brevicollis TaxID=81824 RepID=A9UPI3_MONBE|nr:uncharacterized protein MONBRDRAFT_4973 [Monosiga brevicollis MX1]EDQ92875.1 predicted protein [Monosiga brevicollis MX1]|eukprot:XP_001742637.1 hypothetical protein [Monosiga brevicollis MX1]
MAPRFAANLSFLFTELPFLERFRAAAEHGFRAVEFAWEHYELDPAAVRTALQTANLTCALINTPKTNAGEAGCAAHPAKKQEFAQGLQRALEYCKALDCSKLHIMSGPRVAGADLAEQTAVMAENLAMATTLAAEANVVLTLEPICPAAMADYFLQHVDQALDLIARVGRPNLKYQFDVYHAQLTHGNLTETLRRTREVLGHVQVSQLPGRHEPVTADGEVNLDHLYRTLDELGYQGYIGAEYRPRQRTEDNLAWLTAV